MWGRSRGRCELICSICKELEEGMVKEVCNVCLAKISAIVECDTPEKAEVLVKQFLEYPTSKSALIKEDVN